MQSLTQAKAKHQEAGSPLPMPISALRREGVYIRKGQLTLLAAGSGGGKTALIHSILHKGHEGKKPSVLYFSADSGPNIIWKRAAALSTGKEQVEVERLQEAGALEHVNQRIASEEGHIKWDFSNELTPERVVSQINAYVELNDRYPDAVVIDNAKDLADPSDGDEFRSLEDAMVFMRDLAGQTNIAFITLHHVSGSHEDSNSPIPMSGLRGKISKSPALILTIHRPMDGEMRVSIVKHRDGKASTDGLFFVRLRVSLDKMEFTG